MSATVPLVAAEALPGPWRRGSRWRPVGGGRQPGGPADGRPGGRPGGIFAERKRGRQGGAAVRRGCGGDAPDAETPLAAFEAGFGIEMNMEETTAEVAFRGGGLLPRPAEALLTAGRVTVNGATAHVGDRADPDRDEILGGRRAPDAAGEDGVLLLNKPRGVCHHASDEKGRPTVAELVSGLRCAGSIPWGGWTWTPRACFC